jgi:SnoaL-like domain
MTDPIETYLPALVAGDRATLLSAFAGELNVNEPILGAVHGPEAFERYAAQRQARFQQMQARVEPIRFTRTTQRGVAESLVHLQVEGKDVEVPTAVVGDYAPGGKLSAVRVYHSMWPLMGTHQVRPALLSPDLSARETDIVAEYQHALDSGDIDAIVNTFEPDGYFREPAGGPWIYRGHEKLRTFMGELLSHGGIILQHCTVTDDGVACALEFNAVKFGTQPLVPQAGVAVYERGPSGKLHAARIYDDVNVEALAKGSAS